MQDDLLYTVNSANQYSIQNRGERSRYLTGIAGQENESLVRAKIVFPGLRRGYLIPMMMLCHEHDPDPEMRPDPISPEKREGVIVQMAVGLLAADRYFREHREAYTDTTATSESPRNVSKVGRNDLCPCGSGRSTSDAAAGRR